MFLASKLLAFAIEPLVWVLCLLLGGLLSWSRWPRLGRGLAWGALVALLLSGWELIPNTLIRGLESRYPPPPAAAAMPRYVGVVVLGGALSNSDLWTAHRQVALNANAERMTTAVSLALRYPHIKLLYTGGIATVAPEGLTEAVRARMFFDQMGVGADRVVYEDKSRTTYENAIYSASVPGVNKQDPWLLLTSAYHMPRTMGVFLKAGWNVTPYPVDYRSAAPSAWYDFSLHDGPHSWQLALHELLGYLAYRMNGMI